VSINGATAERHRRSERCSFSCEGEESTLDYVAARLGPARLLYASDYWHIDARFPGTVAEIRERPGLSAEAKALILGGNAARLYRL